MSCHLLAMLFLFKIASESKVLLEAQAGLCIMKKDYNTAFQLYLKLKRPDVFPLVEGLNLFEAVGVAWTFAPFLFDSLFSV